MNAVHDFFILGQFAVAVRKQAGWAGLDEAECLFCLQADLGRDARSCESWLVVTRTKIAAFAVGRPPTEAVLGLFDLSTVSKVRTRQTVGSAFLQVKVDGIFIDLVRYTNARREHFGRAATEIGRLIDGESTDGAAVGRPSDRFCETCGMPLPGRGADCTRCKGRHGILIRTLKLMAPYTTSIAFLLMAMLLGVGLDLLPPMLTRTLVDKVLAPQGGIDLLSASASQKLLLAILLGLVAASGGRALLNIVITRTSSKVGTRITKELRERLQTKLMDMSVEYYNRHSVGSLMSRVLYDVDYFQSFVSQVSQGFLLNLMLVLGIGTVLFVMNWKLAFLVMLPVPFVVVGTIFFWRYVYPRYYKLSDSQSKMYQLLSGLLSGIRLVKVFGQEARERQRFSGAAGYMQETRRNLDYSTGTFYPIMGFVFGLGGLIIWYAGGHQVLSQHMSLGTLMAFFGYMAMFYGPIQTLTMFSNWMTGFISSGQRVFEVLDSHAVLPEDADPVRLPAIRGAIELRNVTFGYDPYTPVLKNVSMVIEPGQFVGIVGKSGSGKTTLINLICRFYDSQVGEVRIDDIDVRTIDKDDLHRNVGLVLQEPFLFRASIAENIAYGRPDADALDIINAARAANAHDFIARRASGYDTKLGENGAGLSGGERQRISIARALLCDPRILILDEATSSVDTESEQDIQKALAILCRGRTTIAIAHRLSTLKNADIIFVFDEGRVAESGTHDHLMTKQGIYHKLVMIQTDLTRLET